MLKVHVVTTIVLLAGPAAAQSRGMRGVLEGEQSRPRADRKTPAQTPGTPAPPTKRSARGPATERPAPIATASPRRSLEPPSRLGAEALDAVRRANHLPDIGYQHRQEFAQELARSITPEVLDEVLTAGNEPERAQLATGLLGPWIDRAGQDPSFATYDNFVRAVMLMEAVDPSASPADLAKLVRRHFYTDDLFETFNVTVGGEPDVNARLRALDASLGSFSAWREIPGTMGRKFPGAPTDVGHALVALDVYATRRREGGLTGGRFRGRLDAFVFTDFGDAATEALSFVGVKGVGDYSDPDANGNQLGHELIRGYDRGIAPTLSDLLKRFAKTPDL